MDKIRSDGGYTLIEIVFVLVITGSILAAMTSAFFTWQSSIKRSETRNNLSIIADAMSAYASRNYRVPCPADPSDAGAEPFGYEIGSGANGDALGVCNNAGAEQPEGIVPFAVLGLNSDVIRDGWGNYITYQVDTAFTQDPEDPTGVIQVHARCRTLDWVEGAVMLSNGPDDWLDGGRNIAPLKARFCCMQQGAVPITVYTTPAPDLTNPSVIYRADPLTWYATISNAVPNLVDPNDNHTNENGIIAGDPEDPVTLIAGAQTFYDDLIYGGGRVVGGNTIYGHTDMPVYALISHGENEAGAFVGNGTLNRLPGGGADEQQNANAAQQNIRDLPQNTSAGATYFDDIILWQTQSDILKRLGRNSCMAP